MVVSNLEQLIRHYTYDAAQGINELRGARSDQSGGNQCGLLTLAVYNNLVNHPALLQQRTVLKRELHQDDMGNWHYMLKLGNTQDEPTESDTIADLNPWQFNGKKGSGILYGARADIMDTLSQNNAPDFFVALRGIETITHENDTRTNPHRPLSVA